MIDCSFDSGVPWRIILAIAVAGGLSIAYLVGLARVGELDREGRRLDALIANEITRQGDLARGRAALCNAAELERFAPTHNMVKAPVKGQRVVVGILPAPDRTISGELIATGQTPTAARLSAGASAPAQSGVMAYDFGRRFAP